MFDTKFFEDLATRLSNTLPESLRSAKQDVEKNFRQVLESAFNKLDLVTRSEFETQSKVLLRTREKLEKIEQEIANLENQLKGNKKSTKTAAESDNDN